MDEKFLEDNLQVDGFDLDVFTAADCLAAFWKIGNTVVAQASIKPFADGYEWATFHVMDEFRGNGIYKKAVELSTKIDAPIYARAVGLPEENIYRDSGFDDSEYEGYLKQTDHKANTWLSRFTA